jgi:hypothetical protein
VRQRWKLEIWLDHNQVPVQINVVVVDPQGRLLEVRVEPVDHPSRLARHLEQLISELGPFQVQQALFDGLAD